MEEKTNEKIIDMHTHSNYSDGELSPIDLVKSAIDKNIGVLSITDHNTIEGIKQIDRNEPVIVNSGIKIVNGIELSAKSTTGRMHILGYGFDLNNEILNKIMNTLRDNSINSVLSVMEQIKRDYGIIFGYEDIKKMINGKHDLGRPDIAKLCVQYGYATNMKEAFAKYLIDAHKKTKQYNHRLSYSECFDLINNSGGVPVLAHPKSLELDKKEFLILIRNMIDCGLKGIEVYHSTHSKDEMKFYLEVANEFNLLVSGGSDFHGPIAKPDVELGHGKNDNIKIKKLSLLDNLKINI